MDTCNYFIKLLMLSADGSDFMLIYGFCTATTHPSSTWKQHEITKTHQSIWTAILSETEATAFIKSLTQSGMISLGEKSFSSPKLVERPMVLSNDGDTNTTSPISEYRQLIEFWNVQKCELFQRVKSAFGTDGKELYQGIKALFDWARGECGIDFLRNGHRFGNFEFYQTSTYVDAFEIETHKECALTKTTIRKKQKLKDNFIVNCVSTCRGRSIVNQTQIFTAEETSLDFLAEEPMSHVVIQIWDEKSGDLVFSKSLTLMMGVTIGMNWGSTQYRIRDPWSEKLFSTAANRSDIIKNQIETVSRTTSDRTLSINSSTRNSIDTAMDEGNSLFCDYRHPCTKGAFVPNRQKDGEIESFLKIRKYIEPSTVKKVVIADPYFSVPAAAKLLTRIPRTDVQIDIITSLGKTDPDTGTESSVCEDYRRFLLNHLATLHSNLFICNLRRGEKPVFHDRYLIRYFDNGTIDGFLLSNSLNSMGQFYPFVIAPMEHEVCLEVCDYLNSMCDSIAQNKLPKKERIICDVLFDSRTKATSSSKLLSDSLPLNTWLAAWSKTDSSISVPVQDLPAAAQIILDHWSENEELACRTLCALDSVTCPWSPEKLAGIIKKIDGAVCSFLDVFIPIAKRKEITKNHIAKGLESNEYKLWALLNDMAKPSRQGFSLLFKQAGHIWYSGDSWLHGGYNLLLWLHPTAYAELMEEIKSPLMFDTLVARMLFYPWSDQLFYTVTEVGTLYSQLICAEWILEQLKSNKLSAEQIDIILAELAPEKRVLQAVRLVSEITFYVRTSALAKLDNPKWDSLCTWLLNLIALDISKCTAETITQVIYWLYDCEDESNCALHLRLSEIVGDQTIRDALLDEAIEIARHSLLSCSYNKDVSKLVSMYLQGMDARYGQEAEKRILGKFVNWNIFEIASEPELKNYAYDKWYSANVRAQWQMEILRVYHQHHPESDKASQWISRWEGRLGKN